MDDTASTRFSVTLPMGLLRGLDELGRTGRVTRSAIIADALRSWINRKGEDELELRFAARLDRISRQLGRIERIARVDVESLGLLIRYLLTINAPIPEGDESARAIGRDRFAAFVERVGRQLASGRLTLVPEESE